MWGNPQLCKTIELDGQSLKVVVSRHERRGIRNAGEPWIRAIWRLCSSTVCSNRETFVSRGKCSCLYAPQWHRFPFVAMIDHLGLPYAIAIISIARLEFLMLGQHYCRTTFREWEQNWTGHGTSHSSIEETL